ncbi:MAG TPA: hypothetical protein PLU30_05670 [Verrucomicrobiae bacterium]|nr:hypothetical protein [Verrucomicrobiae bacterium]
MALIFVLGTVLDNRLGAHFGSLSGWFGDRRPNLVGHHVIGDETVNVLARIIRAKFGKGTGGP